MSLQSPVVALPSLPQATMAISPLSPAKLPSTMRQSSSPSSSSPAVQPRRTKKKPATRPLPESSAAAGQVSAQSDGVEAQSRSSPLKPAAPASHAAAGRRKGRHSPSTPIKASHLAPPSDTGDDSQRHSTLQRPSAMDIVEVGADSCGIAPPRPLTPTLVTQPVPAQQNRARHARSRSAVTLLVNAQHTEWDMPLSSHRQPPTQLTWQQQQPPSTDVVLSAKDRRPPRRRSKSLKAAPERVQSTPRHKDTAGHSHVGAIRINATPSNGGHDFDPFALRRGLKYPASVPNSTPLAHGLLQNEDPLASALTWQQSLFRDSQVNDTHKLSVADLFGPLEAEPRKTPQSAPVSPPKRSGKKGMNGGGKAHAEALEFKLAKLAGTQPSPVHVFAASPSRQPSQLASSSPSPPHYPISYPSNMSPLKAHSNNALLATGAYAGPGFHNSPNARELPIPKFMIRGQAPQSAMDGFSRPQPITVSQ